MPNLINIIDNTENHVEKHTATYQPPRYIATFQARSRDVILNGKRTPFYFGKAQSHSRMTFEWSGVWYYVDAEYPGNQNLNELMWDLDRPFEFSISS